MHSVMWIQDRDPINGKLITSGIPQFLCRLQSICLNKDEPMMSVIFSTTDNLSGAQMDDLR